MTDVLIWADTLRSPEMRHEVPVVVPDPFLYLERNGERHVVITPFEVERVQGHDGLQPHAVEQFGWDDLVRQGMPMEEVELGTAVRAVKELGVEKAIVPTTFPVELADRLRAEGIEITPDREAFVQRRRVKTDAELEGMSRLEQAAAFLALLELRKGNEVQIEQAAPFAPIRVSRLDIEGSSEWRTARSA